MRILIFKLVVTPLLIGGISLLGRRWGPTVGGLLVGLPLTSGPVALFVALDHGSRFAASTSLGILEGGISGGLFCLTYSHLAFRWRWPAALALSWGAFFASTAALREVSLPLLPTYACVIAALALVVVALPRGQIQARDAVAPARWDIPARMLIATVFVVLLTAAAPALGPRLSGLLAPFPLFAAILAVFTHHADGPGPAARLLRGVVIGMFAFASFFLVVAGLLTSAGIAVAFVSASAVTLAMQGASLWLFGRTRSHTEAATKDGVIRPDASAAAGPQAPYRT